MKTRNKLNNISVHRFGHMRSDTMSYENHMNNLHPKSLLHHNHSHNTEHKSQNKSKSHNHLLKDEINKENISKLNNEDKMKEVPHFPALPEDNWPKLPNTTKHLIHKNEIQQKYFHININHKNYSTFKLVIINLMIIWHTFKLLITFNRKNFVNQFHKACNRTRIAYSEALSAIRHSNENHFSCSSQNIFESIVEDDIDEL